MTTIGVFRYQKRTLHFVEGKDINWKAAIRQWRTYYLGHKTAHTRLAYRVLRMLEAGLSYDKLKDKQGQHTRGLVSNRGLEGVIRYAAKGKFWEVQELTSAPWNTQGQSPRISGVGSQLLMGVMVEANDDPEFEELVLSAFPEAAPFYKRFGFDKSRNLTLYIDREHVRKTLRRLKERKTKKGKARK